MRMKRKSQAIRRGIHEHLVQRGYVLADIKPTVFQQPIFCAGLAFGGLYDDLHPKAVTANAKRILNWYQIRPSLKGSS